MTWRWLQRVGRDGGSVARRAASASHARRDARRCATPRLSRVRRAPPLTREPLRPCAVLFDISQLLNTGLDRATLNVLVGLTETGANPEALAAVVKELRRESAALEASQPTSQPSVESLEERAFPPSAGRLDK